MKTQVYVTVFHPRGLKQLLEEPPQQWLGLMTPLGNARGEGRHFTSSSEHPGKGHGPPRERVQTGEQQLGKGNRHHPHGETEMSSPRGGKPVKKCLYPQSNIVEAPVLPEVEAWKGERMSQQCPKRWRKAPAKLGGSHLGMASPCPHRPALSSPQTS